MAREKEEVGRGFWDTTPPPGELMPPWPPNPLSARGWCGEGKILTDVTVPVPRLCKAHKPHLGTPRSWELQVTSQPWLNPSPTPPHPEQNGHRRRQLLTGLIPGEAT